MKQITKKPEWRSQSGGARGTEPEWRSQTEFLQLQIFLFHLCQFICLPFTCILGTTRGMIFLEGT